MTGRDHRNVPLTDSGIDTKYTPWRGDWMETDEEFDRDGCVFCQLPEQSDDRETLVLARSAESYVVLNIRPYNPGHVMIVPRTHEAYHYKMAPSTVVDYALTLRTTTHALANAFEPDGFNTGANLGQGSGGSVDGHLHLHVIPRWLNDTDFLPIIGETTLVEESLLSMYDKAHDALIEVPATDGTVDSGAVWINHESILV